MRIGKSWQNRFDEKLENKYRGTVYLQYEGQSFDEKPENIVVLYLQYEGQSFDEKLENIVVLYLQYEGHERQSFDEKLENIVVLFLQYEGHERQSFDEKLENIVVLYLQDDGHEQYSFCKMHCQDMWPTYYYSHTPFKVVIKQGLQIWIRSEQSVVAGNSNK